MNPPSHFLPGWWMMIDYSTDNMCLMSSRFKFHSVLGNARSDSYWVFGDLVVLWTLCCCRRWLKRRKRMLVERRKFGNLRERRNTRGPWRWLPLVDGHPFSSGHFLFKINFGAMKQGRFMFCNFFERATRFSSPSTCPWNKSRTTASHWILDRPSQRS